AATEPGRPIVIGTTCPGNKTMLRTGMMMSASGGSGGPGVGVPAVPSCAVPGKPASATESTSFLQRDQKAAVNSRAANAAVRSGRKTYTALETSLRKVKAMNNRCLQFQGKQANAGYN